MKVKLYGGSFHRKVIEVVGDPKPILHMPKPEECKALWTEDPNAVKPDALFIVEEYYWDSEIRAYIYKGE